MRPAASCGDSSPVGTVSQATPSYTGSRSSSSARIRPRGLPGTGIRGRFSPVRFAISVKPVSRYTTG